MATYEKKVSFDDAFMSEKISIEPDLGDQRQSIYKALPAPPTTPKRVLKKYRVSAIIPFVFAAASFLLTLVVVLAGQSSGIFNRNYLVAINMTGFGNGIEQLQSGNPTNTTISAEIEIEEMYFLHLQTVCSGFNRDEGFVVELCESWDGAINRIMAYATRFNSSIAPEGNMLLPSTKKIVNSLGTISSSLSQTSKVVFAFLIVSLIGSSLSAISAVPAILFPQSRLLIYFNIAWPCLASIFAFISAIILTIVMSGLTSLVAPFGRAFGLEIEQGHMVLLFAWLTWLFVGVSSIYWTSVWCVEVRKFSLRSTRRDSDEIGNWRGILGEICRSLQGTKEHQID